MDKRLGIVGLGISLLVMGTVLSCQATGYEPTVPSVEQTSQPSLEDDTSPNAAVDTLDLPPSTRTAQSTDGQYTFTVQANSDWETDQVSGSLFRDSAVGTQRLWQQDLPHSYGPRFVVVGTQGEVLLLDEAINIASPYAVTLLDRDGNVIAQHSFDEIEAQLSVHRAQLVEQAEYGWWISAPPQLDTDAGVVNVATGGHALSIDLTTGEMAPKEMAPEQIE